MTILTEEQETQWIQLAKGGDREAFGLIVEKYWTPIQRHCYRMLGNTRDAEDAAQEVFLRAFLSLDRFDSQRRFSPWIYTIASRYCIDQLRKKRLQTLPLDGERNGNVQASNKFQNPESIQVMTVQRDQVQFVLAHLAPKDQKVVFLRHWYGYSYKEIGQSLSLTTNAVKGRLHRARRKFARIWDAHQFIEP